LIKKEAIFVEMESDKEFIDKDNENQVVENTDIDQTSEIKGKNDAENENNTKTDQNTNIEYNSEIKPPIKYGILGSEDIPIDKEAYEFAIGNQRIGKMQGFEECVNFEVFYWFCNSRGCT